MLKLHFAPNSRAERILWLLEELELPYELNEMAFHPSDLKSDEHRARHPLGRIPVLDDGDIQIWESGAITEYIIEKYKNGGLKPDVQSELLKDKVVGLVKKDESSMENLSKTISGLIKES